jgi:hypothetical protein
VPVLTVVLFMDAQAVIVVGVFELGNSNGKLGSPGLTGAPVGSPGTRGNHVGEELLVACPAAD